jgi:hypothetical protein
MKFLDKKKGQWKYHPLPYRLTRFLRLRLNWAGVSKRPTQTGNTFVTATSEVRFL